MLYKLSYVKYYNNKTSFFDSLFFLLIVFLWIHHYKFSIVILTRTFLLPLGDQICKQIVFPLYYYYYYFISLLNWLYWKKKNSTRKEAIYSLFHFPFFKLDFFLSFFWIIYSIYKYFLFYFPFFNIAQLVGFAFNWNTYTTQDCIFLFTMEKSLIIFYFNFLWL